MPAHAAAGARLLPVTPAPRPLEGKGRRVARAALVVLAALALAGCGGGSRPASAKNFAADVRASCLTYKTDLEAATQIDLSAPDAGDKLVHGTTEATRRWLAALRRLVPPARTGVTVATWQREIDLQRRELPEYDGLLKKISAANGKADAETERRLRKLRADAARWKAVAQHTGVERICAAGGPARPTP